MSLIAITGLLALVLAAIHIFAGKLRFLDVIPRSHWLSGAGGAAVAYVFIHLLPEISRGQSLVSSRGSFTEIFREQHIYLTALFGLVIFYGLERAAKMSRSKNQRTTGTDAAERNIFWLHIVSFGIYNALIGYLLLHRESTGLLSLLFFWLAMALHFLTNDYDLRQDLKAAYKHIGRWILSILVMVGWAIGAVYAVNKVTVAFLFAFLAGGVVLNVLKGELPEERQSSFWAFLGGAVLYALLLLFI